VAGIACRDLVLGLGTPPLHDPAATGNLIRTRVLAAPASSASESAAADESKGLADRASPWPSYSIARTPQSDTICVPLGGFMFAAQMPTQRTIGVWFETHGIVACFFSVWLPDGSPAKSHAARIRLHRGHRTWLDWLLPRWLDLHQARNFWRRIPLLAGCGNARWRSSRLHRAHLFVGVTIVSVPLRAIFFL